jgi:hypothetical protein
MNIVRFVLSRGQGWYLKNRPAFWIAVLITVLGTPWALPTFTVEEISPNLATCICLGWIIMPATLLGDFVSQPDQVGTTGFYAQPGIGAHILAILSLFVLSLIIGEIIQFVFRLKKRWIRIPFVVLSITAYFVVLLVIFASTEWDDDFYPGEYTCELPITNEHILQVSGIDWDTNMFLRRSTDSGKTWTKLLYTPNHIDCASVQIIDENTFTITSPKGTVNTTDGGKTWQVQGE